MKYAMRESRRFFEESRQEGGVVFPHNLVLGSSLARYVALA